MSSPGTQFIELLEMYLSCREDHLRSLMAVQNFGGTGNKQALEGAIVMLASAREELAQFIDYNLEEDQEI